MSVTELSEKVGITIANLSILKNGKAKAIRLSTLKVFCETLDCQPGDILEYKSENSKLRSLNYSLIFSLTPSITSGNSNFIGSQPK